MFADSPPARMLRRLLAVGAAALVFALTILAASPEAHERVHSDCHHDADHTCAVVLFAHGIWSAFGAVVVHAPAPAWAEFVSASRPELHLAAPRYLRQPERGPPVS